LGPIWLITSVIIAGYLGLVVYLDALVAPSFISFLPIIPVLPLYLLLAYFALAQPAALGLRTTYVACGAFTTIAVGVGFGIHAIGLDTLALFPVLDDNLRPHWAPGGGGVIASIQTLLIPLALRYSDRSIPFAWPRQVWLISDRKYRRFIADRLSAEAPFVDFFPIRGRFRNRPDIVIRAANLMDHARTVLIIGEAGSGKSALLRYLAQTIANRSRDLIPIYLELWTLQLWNESSLQIENAAISFLRSCGVPNPAGYYMDLGRKGRIVFLIDGLSEIPQRNRASILDEIRALERQFPDCRIYVASRQSDYRADQFFQGIFELLPLSEAEMVGFAFSLLPVADVEKYKILRILESLPGSLQNPFMLTLMAEIRGHSVLPSSPSDLIDLIVRTQLSRRRAALVNPFPPDVARAFLVALAHAMANTGEDHISRAEATQIAKSMSFDISAEELLNETLITSGLITETAAGQVMFVHAAILDYFLEQDAAAAR
jgi:energy-coupling factor transporter ATP-binding protein EcfA2